MLYVEASLIDTRELSKTKKGPTIKLHIFNFQLVIDSEESFSAED